MPPLIIRAEQMAVLSRQFRVQWLEERLSELYPSFAAASASDRDQWIQGGLARASAFGLRGEDHLPFLCLEQTFGPGWLDRPEYRWARQILEARTVEPGQRMRNLKKGAIRRLLEEEDRIAAQAAAAEAGQGELPGDE